MRKTLDPLAEAAQEALTRLRQREAEDIMKSYRATQKLLHIKKRRHAMVAVWILFWLFLPSLILLLFYGALT